MPFSIASNVPSLIAQRNLSRQQEGYERAIERLSSGYRVNSASDDPAGVAVISRLSARISGLGAATRNANTGLSMAETAEGSLAEMTTVVDRRRELAVEASNGVLTSADRTLLDTEFAELIEEVDRIASASDHGTTELLSGASVTYSYQVGAEAGATTLDVTFGAISTTTLAISTSTLSGSGTKNASDAITAIDLALETINTRRASFGGAVSAFEFSISHNDTLSTNLEESLSRLRDADIAEESALLARYKVMIEAGAAVLAQANQLPSITLALLGVSGT